MPKPFQLRTVTLAPVRRPAGMISVRLGHCPKRDQFKGRAEWLLEALGAYHSHRAGYCLSPEKAAVFVLLYEGGWEASRRLMRYWKYMEADKTPYTFTSPKGQILGIKQVLRNCRQLKKCVSAR